jgi:hypothetical protein
LEEKHGTKRRRAWKMLHLAMDADTGQIVASVLTDRDVDDGSQVGYLLDGFDGSVVAVRRPDALVIVSPRKRNAERHN